MEVGYLTFTEHSSRDEGVGASLKGEVAGSITAQFSGHGFGVTRSNVPFGDFGCFCKLSL